MTPAKKAPLIAARRGFAAIAAMLVVAASSAAQNSPPEQKLLLTPTMLLDETASGGGSLGELVDEQEVSGDPAVEKGGKPSRPFAPGWDKWRYPVQVMIDLGARHRVTRLFFYNETGQANVMVSTGKPFAWSPKAFTISGYRSWFEAPMGSVETRYLRLTLLGPASLSEMVVYGVPLEKKSPAVPVKSVVSRRPPPTMDQLIGLNAFIDDPVDKITPPAGLVREYHNWSWDVEGSDGKRRFQPSGAAGGNSWFFDDYYAALKQRGVTVCPAIQNNVPALFGTTATTEAKPIKESADAEDPASYNVHAAHLFQFAARYGRRKVDDRLLDLAPGQPRRSGLGLLRYVENWNEPDKTWRGRESRFHPYELAAMCSADYDGQQGRMGNAVGVKNADPAMRLVIGGLAGLNLEYLRAMKLWADYHRGVGSFPADVINLHHYSSDGNEQGFKPGGHGISPEDDHLREKLTAIAAWRDANLPDRELWLTEFGYDTNPASPLHAPALGKMIAEEVQAAWLLRSYFSLAASGVDRAAMFMLRDVNSTGTGVFDTCGLVTEKGQWKPKPSWYYLATLKTRLAGLHFGAELMSGRGDVRIYRFDSAKAKGAAYAVWCPTSEDKRVTGFRMRLQKQNATRIQFVPNERNGIATPCRVEAGTVVFDVGETPTLILSR